MVLISAKRCGASVTTRCMRVGMTCISLAFPHCIAAASLAEEAVPLRESSISPPRPRSSPLHPDDGSNGGAGGLGGSVRGRSARSGDLATQNLLHRPGSDLR